MTDTYRELSHELPRTPADEATLAARRGKLKVATISLCGCWGCNLSTLDLDERLLPLLDRVTIDRSSFTDIKRITGRCDVGLVEGGVANEENIETLRHFREHCDVLVSVGACANWGGVPSLRNSIGLGECLATAFLDSPTAVPGDRPTIPLHPEIPQLTDRVYPCHEVVHMDYFLPGCPPSNDAVFAILDAVAHGRPIELPTSLTHFD